MNEYEKHIHRGNLKPEPMPSEYEALRNDIEEVAVAMAGYAGAVSRHVDAVHTTFDDLWKDNAELRDELHALANRVETLTRARLTEPAEVAEDSYRKWHERTHR